jgi:24-hydroxycholesterol 7alpha-hydroxylase
MDVITLVLFLVVLAISAHLLFAGNDPNAPPCIKGWIPWFGVAFEFGKSPLTFIAQARDKVTNIRWLGYSICFYVLI